MDQSYPITPDAAKRAAADYLAIKRAGLLFELDQQIRENLEAHAATCWLPNGNYDRDSQPIDGFRHGDNWGLRYIKSDAQKLAAMLQCPAPEVEPHIFEALWDGPTTRRIVFDCLRNLANYARRQPQAGRRCA